MRMVGGLVRFERLKLEDDQTGSYVIPLNRTADRAVITVSGLAPVTTEVATYEYEITEE